MTPDEQKTSKMSVEDTEGLSKPKNTQEDGPSAWFTGDFRSNFKNVFAHLLNEEQPQETKNPSREPQLRHSKDQYCIQWCTQDSSRSNPSAGADCRMWCVRRIEKEGNWNPFSGIHFYCIYGLKDCQEQLEEMNANQNSTTWDRAKYHVDLGEKTQKFKDEAVRIVKKTFSPGLEWGHRYLMSWQDGTQSKFFERFSTSIKQGDGLELAKKSFIKIVESLRGEKK